MEISLATEIYRMHTQYYLYNKDIRGSTNKSGKKKMEVLMQHTGIQTLERQRVREITKRKGMRSLLYWGGIYDHSTGELYYLDKGIIIQKMAGL